MVKRFFKVEISKSFITFNFEDGKLTSINYSTSEKQISKNVMQGKFAQINRSDENYLNRIKEILERIFKYNREAFNELCSFTEQMKDIEFNKILKLTIE